MKKMCMFVMFILSVYGMFPAYATTDIAADAESSECVENITGTYSGDANFKAKWTPNNIQLNWHDGYSGTQIIPANTSANTCNYGGALTIPNNPPERIGYIFDGWMAHRPMMNFSLLISLENGSQRWQKSRYYCWHNNTNVSCTSDNEFTELEQDEWKVQFNTGTIKGTLYGRSYCSAKSGIYLDSRWDTAESFSTYDELESASGEKIHCWCQATGWRPDGSSTIYANLNKISWGNISVEPNDAWVYVESRSSKSFCFLYCTNTCADRALRISNFRRALFMGAQ